MGLEFDKNWISSLGDADRMVYAKVNTEEVITAVFTNTKQILIKTDATGGLLLSVATGARPGTVKVLKGLHQDTQVSHNPRDAHRSSHFHITVSFLGGTHHVYLAETAINNAWRIREIT